MQAAIGYLPTDLVARAAGATGRRSTVSIDGRNRLRTNTPEPFRCVGAAGRLLENPVARTRQSEEDSVHSLSRDAVLRAPSSSQVRGHRAGAR